MLTALLEELRKLHEFEPRKYWIQRTVGVVALTESSLLSRSFLELVTELRALNKSQKDDYRDDYLDWIFWVTLSAIQLLKKVVPPEPASYALRFLRTAGPLVTPKEGREVYKTVSPATYRHPICEHWLLQLMVLTASEEDAVQ